MGIFTSSSRTFYENLSDDEINIDLDAVEDNIDGNNSNEDEIEYANDTTGLDPYTSDSADGIVEVEEIEEAYRIMYEGEVNYNRIMEAIGLHELHESTRNREVLYEAVNIKEMFTKFKNWFVGFIKKIQSVIKRWIANIDAQFRTTKSFLSKYESTIKEGEKLSRGDKKVEFDGYHFTGSLEEFKDSIDPTRAAPLDEIKSHLTLNNLEHEDWENKVGYFNATEKEEAADEIRAKLLKQNGKVSSSDFRKEAFKKYHGGDDKKTKVTMSAADCIASLKDPKKYKDNAKKAYADIAKSVKSTISNLNSYEKKLANEFKDNATAKDRAVRVVTQYIDLERSAKTYSHIALQSYLQALRHRTSQARKFANAYVRLVNSDKNKGFRKSDSSSSVKESGFLSGVEFI